MKRRAEELERVEYIKTKVRWARAVVVECSLSPFHWLFSVRFLPTCCHIPDPIPSPPQMRSQNQAGNMVKLGKMGSLTAENRRLLENCLTVALPPRGFFVPAIPGSAVVPGLIRTVVFSHLSFLF